MAYYDCEGEANTCKKKCMICKKGYFLNEDYYCEKRTVKNCISDT